MIAFLIVEQQQVPNALTVKQLPDTKYNQFIIAAFLAGDNVFACVCLSICLSVCLSVTKISQELVEIFQFCFTGRVLHRRGRTD